MTWSVFDWVHPLQRVAVTPMSVNQSTGIVTAPTKVTTSITGNFDPNPFGDEDRQYPGGLVEEGDALLYTATACAIGDIIRVHRDSSMANYTDWRVKGEENPYEFVHAGEAVRHGYILQRVEVE